MSNQIMRKFEVVEDILTTPNDIGEHKIIELWCNEYRIIEDIENEIQREYGYSRVRWINAQDCAKCGAEFDFDREMIVDLNPNYTPSNNQPRFINICYKCKCLRQQRDIDALSDAVARLLEKVVQNER